MYHVEIVLDLGEDVGHYGGSGESVELSRQLIWKSSLGR